MSTPSSNPPPSPSSSGCPFGASASGMPTVRHQSLTYGSYLKVSELLKLQAPVSVPPHHDELLFIISHQVYELWFKQTLHEIEAVCRWLDADQPLRAAQAFERILKILHLLIEQIPVLETMFSTEFAKFRDGLRPASGFQSVQFRKLEFICGAKNARILDLVGDDSAARDEMATFLARPTPYDHFVRHLAREDNRVFAIPAEVLNRDTGAPHQSNEAMISALEVLYRKQDTLHTGERYYAQFRVAEHLLEFDERLAIWRFHHVKMVERMIGGGGGTGGSTGAKYLASTLATTRLYPDLWAVRDRFGSSAAAT